MNSNEVTKAASIKNRSHSDESHRPSPTAKPETRVAALLPLTSTQRAFVVHQSAFGSTAMGAGQLVVSFTITSSGFSLDDALLEQAWQKTVDQHEMLRCTVQGSAKAELHLVVRQGVSASLTIQPSDAQVPIDDYIQQLRNDALATPLDISALPGYQLQGYRVDDHTLIVLWNCHHLLLDGWSAGVVIDHWMEHLHNLSLTGSTQALPTTPYSDYRRWLKQHSQTESEQFWREYLAEHHHPTLLTKPANLKIVDRHATDSHLQPAKTPKDKTTQREELSAIQLNTLMAFCEEQSITNSTLIQAAWALCLSAICQQDSVLFGLAISGRPAQLKGSDTVVGLLAGVVPVRVQCQQSDVLQWLGQIQHRQFSAMDHGVLPLDAIMQQAEPACSLAGFDSLLVIENLPNHTTPPGLSVNNYASDIVSAYPLTLTVIPGEQWTLRCDYDSTVLSERWIDQLLQCFKHTLCAIPHFTSASVPALLNSTGEKAPTHPDPRALHIRTNVHSTIPVKFHGIVGPSNDTELDMISLWEDVLRYRPLSMEANFFEAGGTSLAAIRLIAAIEKHFGQRLRVADLLEHPTPAHWVSLLSKDTGTTQGLRVLLTLQADGRKPGLFCLHAGGGHALFYRDFAKRMGNERPVYALQPKGIDGLEEPIDTLEEMATVYVNAMLLQQQEGPFHLLCYCFGGALMLEIVKRLEAQGKTIGRLIVADAPSPVPAAHPMASLGWKGYLLYEYARHGSWPFFAQAAIKQANRIMYIAKNWISSDNTSHSLPSHLTRVQVSCEQAFKRYRAQPTDLPVHFLLGNESDTQFSNSIHLKNWDVVAPVQHRVELIGNHREIFSEPFVVETATAVKTLLEDD